MLKYLKKRFAGVNAHHIVEMLPITGMQKVRLHRNLLHRKFDEAAAQGDGDHQYMQYLHAELARDFDDLEDQESMLLTRQLCAKASRLRVPIPGKIVMDTTGMKVFWRDIFDGEQEALTEDGLRRLTDDIRAEIKWRRESRNHRIGYIGVITGAIGAAAALATVLHDIAKKDDPPACLISVDSHGVTSMKPPAKRQ